MLLWCIILFIPYWIQFVNIWGGIFASLLMRDNWSVIFFSCNVFVWFWY